MQSFFSRFSFAEFFSSYFRQSSLARQPPLQQSLICRIFFHLFFASLFWGQSLKTAITSAVFDHCFLSAVFSAVFVDSHYLGSLWWQSFKTAFADNHHFSSLWWESFKAAITSAVFDDSVFSRKDPSQEPDTCIQCTYIEIFILTNTRIFKNTFHIYI